MTKFYYCNPELFLSCEKTLCGKECRLTSFEKYAQRDEFGRPIVACFNDIFEQGENKEEE